MYYDPNSSIFWYKVVFMVELLVSQILFTRRLARKNKYALRLLMTVALDICAAFAIPVFGYNAVFVSLLFFVLFALSTVIVKLLCYNESWQTVIFYSVAALCVQHISFELYNFIVLTANLNNGLPLEVYGDTLGETYDMIIMFVQFVTVFVTYWLGYLAFGRRDIERENTGITKVIISAVTVAISIVFNALITYYGYKSPDRFYLAIASFLISACCVLALCVQFGFISNRIVKRERDIVRLMWEQEQKQYAMLRDNIDYINIKCHDFKHRIHDIGANILNEKEIKQIQDVISIYDSSLKTGNEALDVVLMDKTLLCRRLGISFTCIADGRALSFMETSDIYSLFGNILDNAIEALRKIEEKEKRVVGLDVRRCDGGVKIESYNYCPVKPEFRDGIPLTTQTDKTYHGFGMKSMQMLSNKYGGSFRVYIEDNNFNLEIIFPQTAADGEEICSGKE